MKHILAVTEAELERIVSALSLMQDVDDQSGHPAEAATTRSLIDRIVNGISDTPALASSL